MDLRQRFQGSLLGACLGDGSGSGIETLPHDYLRSLDGGRGFVPFVRSKTDRIKGIWAGYTGPRATWAEKIQEFLEGETSDDWQLTGVCAESLVASKGWNLEDCGRRHVVAYDQSEKGWGGTTREGIGEFRDGKRAYTDPAKNKGCGNRPLMSGAPLCLFFAARAHVDDEQLRCACIEYGFMTHGDPRASIAVYAVALVYEWLFRRQMNDLNDARDCLASILPRVRVLEDRFRAEVPHGEPSISERLSRLPDVWADRDSLREAWGTDGHSLITCPFALGSFFRHPMNGRDAFLEVLNAGGDADTNASIVGALIGANAGPQAFPEAWINYRPKYQYAWTLADRLYDVAMHA